MRKIKARRPSPSMVVAVAALAIALVGTAMAAPTAIKSVLNKQEKKQVANIAKNQVNGLASGLSVANATNATNATNANNAANATNANNANTLDALDSADFLQVKTRVRQVSDSLDSNFGSDANLLQLSNLAPGQWAIQGRVEIDREAATNASINCDLVSSTGVLTEIDTLTQVHGATTGIANRLGYSLLSTFTAGAGGTDDVFIRCSGNDGVDDDARQMRIIATLANN